LQITHCLIQTKLFITLLTEVYVTTGWTVRDRIPVGTRPALGPTQPPVK